MTKFNAIIHITNISKTVSGDDFTACRMANEALSMSYPCDLCKYGRDINNVNHQCEFCPAEPVGGNYG